MFRKSAIFAALSAVFAGAAAAQDAAPGPGSLPPMMADQACLTFLTKGTDNEACARSIRHWADFYARQQEELAVHPRGMQSYGESGDPVLVPPSMPGEIPRMHGEVFAGHIRTACGALRALDEAAPLPQVVRTADQCLRVAYVYAAQSGADTWPIEYLGGTLNAVGVTLERKNTPQP